MSKTYFRNGRPVLAMDSVSLNVEPGEVIAVLGGRASGKTTMLKVAAGLERPDSGHVEIDGRRLDELSDRELTGLRRTVVGGLWSSAAPVARSRVLDVVALPLRLQNVDGRAALAEADRALQAIDAGHCAYASLDELSDGERQLVALAQALITKPRLLLLDQPAANLPVADERSLLALFRSLATDARVAILMTASNATEAVGAHAIASISEGRLLTGEAFDQRQQANAEVHELDVHRRSARDGTQNA